MVTGEKITKLITLKLVTTKKKTVLEIMLNKLKKELNIVEKVMLDLYVKNAIFQEKSGEKNSLNIKVINAKNVQIVSQSPFCI